MEGRAIRPARDDGPPLRIGISLRALFDLEEEHAIFATSGVEAYVAAQRGLDIAPMSKGCGFEVVSRLLALNTDGEPPLVEVVLLSRNAPGASLRAFAAIREHGLNIAIGSFTSGRPIADLLTAWGIDLFLSKEAEDVAAALARGVAAGRLASAPPDRKGSPPCEEVRIALDGDAVVFNDEADTVFSREGLATFLAHEVENARIPMGEGPFEPLLRKLTRLREACRNAGRPGRLRVALVTARRAPAHARVMHTLRAWKLDVDEIHFVGGGDKAPVLAAFGAHIFFDDQAKNVASAARVVAAAHVLTCGSTSTRA